MNPPFQDNVVLTCESCAAAADKIATILDYSESVHQDAEEEFYQIENPVRDLLNSKIDLGQNILGNFWLERGACNVIVGPSGIGKSVVSIQGAIEAAAGLPVFGIVTPRPLRVVVVQAEDSRNDRITQVQCIKQIAASQENLAQLGLSPEELIERIEANFHIFTTTQLRSAELFETLAREFTDHVSGKSLVDLFFFNPAFSFLKGSASSDEAVKTFLRSELAPFLRKMQAAAIVIHHVPKPPRRGTAKRSAETSMYSPHGSAEWTNGPRGVMTIELTGSPKVFEFTIAKRGEKSAWEPDEQGYFIRYFSHSAKGLPMQWLPASEEEIATATQEVGLTDQDILTLFTTNQPELTRSNISAALSAAGFIVSEDRLDRKLIALVDKKKLVKLPATASSDATYLKPGPAKKKAKEVNAMEIIFDFIHRSMPAGVILSQIRTAMTGICGSASVDRILGELIALGRIYCVEAGKSKRYFSRKAIS